MICPKCHVDMQLCDYQDVRVDRCPRCAGIWLDKGKFDIIVEKRLGHLVDIRVTCHKAPTEADMIAARCHLCDRAMTVLAGADGVLFDWCDSCEGMFCDRGELGILAGSR